MKQSNPILLISATLLKVWRRKAVGLVAGKPHMVAMLLPIVALYGFFAWQIRQLLVPFSGMVAGDSEQAGLVVLVAGLTFGVAVSSTWFLARQTIAVNVPSTLQSLPFMSRTWLRAQSLLFVGAIWLLNSLVALPLFVALGQQQGMQLGWWLLFAELTLLMYVTVGLLLYLLVERVIHVERLRKLAGGLSSLHTIGQVGLVVLVGYGRLFSSGALNRINIGLETSYFTDMIRDGGLGILLPFGAVLLCTALGAVTIDAISRGFTSSVVEHHASRPLSARLLPVPKSKTGTLLVMAWRIILSDKEISMPNLLIIGIVLAAAFGVRAEALSVTAGLILYSIYNVLFLLLFSSWALSVRGRLGTSRAVVYGLPVDPKIFIRTLGVMTLGSILALYAIVELALFAVMGDVTGESLGNIGKNALTLAAVASLTFMLGVMSYAGQKNRLNQVPVAVGFAVTNILGLALLAWLSGKYGMPGLAVAACACVMASVIFATSYEREHILDEV
ncbi:MAG TPA: hypothetical protein VK694_01305 [Verrucomicrobiae bacterium]|nr:hypothetical protein [Verrucomicrobiae bacterium]